MDPKIEIRNYRPDEDAEACRRAWRESGWGDGAKNEEAFRLFAESARSVVGVWNGCAECLVNVHAATLRYLDEEIPLACVTGVTTSRIVRRQGFAVRTTAKALADEAVAGIPVAALGVFEQGFYNRLGFGNGPYESWCTFDPAQLVVRRTIEPPLRLTAEDWEAVHANRLGRRRWHGAATILPAALTRADMLWGDKAFGLGYRDEAGTLTHHLWCSADKPRRGPYSVEWMTFRTRGEFLDLMAVIHSLADQVHSIEVHEPPGLQLQDLLREPFKGRRVTESSPHVQRMSSSAYWAAANPRPQPSARRDAPPRRGDTVQPRALRSDRDGPSFGLPVARRCGVVRRDAGSGERGRVRDRSNARHPARVGECVLARLAWRAVADDPLLDRRARRP